MDYTATVLQIGIANVVVLVERRLFNHFVSRQQGGACIDKYNYIRDAYLQNRRSVIHDGNPPAEEQ